MPPHLPNHEASGQLATQEADIQKLFDDQDNQPIFESLLEEPGSQHLVALTSAYYLRPTYRNGASPPTTLPPEHPLYQKIMELDTSTIQDPLEQHVFSLLQSAYGLKAENSPLGGFLDERATAAMLVPDVIEKCSPKAAVAVLDCFYSGLGDKHAGTTLVKLYRETLAAVGNCVMNDQDESQSGSFYRLKLAHHAAYMGLYFVEDRSPRLKIPVQATREISAIANSLTAMETAIMTDEMGFDEGALNTTRDLMKDPVQGFKIISDEGDFRRFGDCIKDKAVQELINKVIPLFKDSRYLSQEVLGEMQHHDEAAVRLAKLKIVLEQEANRKLTVELGERESTFIRRLLDEDEPQKVVDELRAIMEDPRIIKIKSSDVGQSPEGWEKLSYGMVYNTTGLNMVLEMANKSQRLGNILDKPSPALPQFISLMQGMVKPGSDPSIVIRGAAASIAENYSQASKLVDFRQINHYLNQATELLRDLAYIQADPEITRIYSAFLEKQGSMSAKREVSAARIFKAASRFEVTDIDPDSDLATIENQIIDGFISKLTGTEKALSDDERKRLIEGFGSITPLFTYAQKHMVNHEYRAALSELTLAAANGSYNEWHRGDGSSEAMRALVEAGFLPEGLTAEQYKEWCTDNIQSSYEELVSSSHDTAQAIRDAVTLGSVDITLLAPGYTIDADSLPEIISVRNGLGKLTGMLHKAMAKADGGPLALTELENIEANLGEVSGSREAQNLLSRLKDGHDPQEVSEFVATTRQHLDQLRLLIRIANIDAEEVTTGNLLSEPDQNGKRRPQAQLVDTLNTLKSELPEGLQFIPESVLELLKSHAAENGQKEIFTVEDTIDPGVTMEIGETPQRSCQHYETGGFNQGLVGYFNPEAKILVVRNEKGGIVARVITRLMQDDEGRPVIHTEPVYQSVTSPRIRQLATRHISEKALKMGVEVRGALGPKQPTSKNLRVRKLKMPAVYSDSAGGISRGSLTITA